MDIRQIGSSDAVKPLPTPTLCNIGAEIQVLHRPGRGARHKFHFLQQLTLPTDMSGETQCRQIVSTFLKLAAGATSQQIHSIYKARLNTFQDSEQNEDQNLQA